MRKIILVATLLVTGFINAQVSTTEEEYNYLTKGLNELQEKGLGDLEKKGYDFKPFFTDEIENFTIEYSEFVEIASNKVKAISIKVSKKDKNNVSFYCMPINNKKLEAKFFKIFDENYFNGESYKGRTVALRNSILKLIGTITDKQKNI